MKRYLEVQATATFHIAGQLETDMTTEQFAALSDQELVDLMWDSLANYWENNNIKLRDADIRITEVQQLNEDRNPIGEPLELGVENKE